MELEEDAPLSAEERRRRSNREAQRRYQARLSDEQVVAQRQRSNAQRRQRYGAMSDEARAAVRTAARDRYRADAVRQREGARRRHGANRAVRQEQNKAWKAAHPGRVRAIARRSSKAWRQRYPEKVRLSHAAYRERQRERFRLYWRQRKARKRGAGCEDTAAHRDYALVLLGDPCTYCGSEADTIDHIVPIARGGSDEWDNLTSACGGCNSAKHVRSLLEAL